MKNEEKILDKIGYLRNDIEGLKKKIEDENIIDIALKEANKKVFNDIAKECRKAKDLTQLRIGMLKLKAKYLNTNNTETEKKK